MLASFPKIYHLGEAAFEPPTTILQGPKAINPRYFKSETWASHVNNDLGRQQFAKFVKNMVERIWTQAGTADEVRAFANLLGDDQEWDLLSVGVIVLKQFGAYDKKGPSDPHHFQSCLLWHGIDEIIKDRQKRVKDRFSIIERESVPYDDCIHLRKENLVTRDLFGFSRGRVSTERIERFKQSCDAFASQATGSGLKRSDDKVVPTVLPDFAIDVPRYKSPYIVIPSKLIDVQSRTEAQASQLHGATRNEHVYLTTDHPYCQPAFKVELNTERPRGPLAPDIPDGVRLFDGSGIPIPSPNANKPTSSPCARTVQGVGMRNDPPLTNCNTVYGSNPPQLWRSRPTRLGYDSSLLNIPLVNAEPPQKQRSRAPNRLVQRSTMLAIPEHRANGQRSSSSSYHCCPMPATPSKTKKPVSSDEDDNINDFPPTDLLIECLPANGGGGGWKQPVHNVNKETPNNKLVTKQRFSETEKRRMKKPEESKRTVSGDSGWSTFPNWEKRQNDGTAKETLISGGESS